MSDLVKNWFGEEFASLHPLIQRLHLHGGTLSGDIKLSYGAGVAGLVGKRLGAKLGLPPRDGMHALTVNISHENGQLVWSREFSHGQMVSTFTPSGVFPDGYWLENTGSIELQLGVETKEGGWYWVQRQMLWMGLSVPRFLYPQTKAYKRIVEGKYEFGVALSYRFFGTFVEYSGLLEARASDV